MEKSKTEYERAVRTHGTSHSNGSSLNSTVLATTTSTQPPDIYTPVEPLPQPLLPALETAVIGTPTSRAEEVEKVRYELALLGRKLCPGMSLLWVNGLSPLDTYPWQLHLPLRKSLGFHFLHVYDQGQDFWIQSDNCKHSIPFEAEVCRPCASLPLSKSIRALQSRAEALPPHTSYIYGNHLQLSTQLQNDQAIINKWKLNVRIPSLFCFFRTLTEYISVFERGSTFAFSC